MCNQQINTFTVSKDEWNTKEDTCEACIIFTVVCQNSPEATLNSEKIKSVALAVIKLYLSEGIS